jgi:2-polyprenyl-3-methyl-5-hydroxy-6-metoxy-1,4-benzoquinol methylase
MTVPGPTRQEAAIAYFQGRAAVYGAALGRGLWAWQRRREVAQLLGLAGPLAGCSVLDLGCGSGFYASRAADGGAGPVVAVDAASAMIAAIGDPRLETLVADAATVALGRSFDRIILAGLLEFVADPAAVLANAGRHLAPRGRVVLLAPPDTAGGHLYRCFHRRHGMGITLFGARDIDALGRSIGLVVTARCRLWPFGLLYCLEANP